jgi:hypothetical protein
LVYLSIIQASVNDRTALYLILTTFILSPADALTAVIIVDPVHLPFGVDLITRSGSQSAGGGSGHKLATAKT